MLEKPCISNYRTMALKRASKRIAARIPFTDCHSRGLFVFYLEPYAGQLASQVLYDLTIRLRSQLIQIIQKEIIVFYLSI